MTSSWSTHIAPVTPTKPDFGQQVKNPLKGKMSESCTVEWIIFSSNASFSIAGRLLVHNRFHLWAPFGASAREMCLASAHLASDI